MGPRSSIRLRTRLLLLVLFAVVPAFGLIGYTALDQREHATENANKEAMSLIRLATREQRRLIEDTRERLIGLSKLPAVRLPGPACNGAVAELQKSYPYYANIAVAALDGDVFCSATPLRGPANAGDRSYFRRAIRSRGFSVGEFQVGRITGVSTINFGYPVLDSRGKVQAVVFAALNLRWMEDLMAGVELPAHSAIDAIDDRGTVLARYPEQGAWVGTNQAAAPVIRHILARKQSGTAEIAGLDGVVRLYAFAPLQENAGGNVYVAVGIPTAIAFADVHKHFVRNTILFLLVSLLVAAVAWVGSDVFVLRRIQAITAAIQRAAQGDLSARSGLGSALADDKEELGQLARAFDGMAAALQRKTRALKTLSAGNRTLVRATDEQQLLADMCRIIVEVGEYRFAWIGYAESDEYRTVRPVMQYGFDGNLEAMSAWMGGITWADTEKGRGAAGTAVRTGKPHAIQNILTDPNFLPWREKAMQQGYAAVAAFPLIVGGNAIGVLAIYSHEPDAFDAEELELLHESAEDLAFGIAVLRARRETESAHATIKRLAYYDGLTDLPNHTHFVNRLQGECLKAQRSDRSFALFAIDIKRLRDVNNVLGFSQGDLLLKEVSARVRGALPDDALVARMRGDEFAVLFPARDAEHATGAVRKILDALRTPFAMSGLSLDVRATAGVALFPQHSADPAQLLRHADVALQQASKSGKEYVFYEAGYDEASKRSLAMAGELRQAIEADQLVLYYQPKIDLRDRRVLGAEALVRWMHPARGLIPPDQFIQLAEDTGLIKPLTDWVMQAALAQSCAWRRAGRALPIAVNLSARNLHDADLLHKLKRLLQAHDTEASSLEFEITEGAVMEDPETALGTLTRLHDMGVTLFIDDFGTGYSSLSYLKKLPVDALKIDKSFVLDMMANAESATIVQSIITLAHDLDLKVVAEGVENEPAWNRLAALGCDVAQGYYISRPLPLEKWADWLRCYGGNRGVARHS